MIYLHRHSAIYSTTFVHFHESLGRNGSSLVPYRSVHDDQSVVIKKKKKERKRRAQRANPLTHERPAEKCMQARGVNLFGFRVSISLPSSRIFFNIAHAFLYEDVIKRSYGRELIRGNWSVRSLRHAICITASGYRISIGKDLLDLFL